MKKTIGIALAMALILSFAAYAEEPAPATDPIPAATEEATETTPAEAPTDPEKPDNENALQDALDAYRAAKQNKAVEDLEAELKGYVEAGVLTQEQADLILQHAKDRQTAKEGGPRQGGRQHGQRMPGQQGDSQQPKNGQQRGNQLPDAQSGATPRR